MKKLIPIIMLLIGSGAGVGAGIFLRPVPVVDEAAPEDKSEVHADEKAHDKDHEKSVDNENDGAAGQGMEYVRLPNQFVVPLVAEDRISAMVVMSLSVEVTSGYSEDVLEKEPKLRDGFLRVLFDHASIGGFDGAFINNENLDVVRRKLRDVAKSVMGSDIVNDVLIFEIARQDY